MNCRKIERLILKSFDGRLSGREEEALAGHLRACPACRRAEREYRAMLGLLREGREAAPLPGFWERLQPRLREETELVPLLFCELDQSAALLLENRDPLSVSQAYFEADRPETRTMMLLFASLDDKSPVRRPTP
jgi:hypothetical protein